MNKSNFSVLMSVYSKDKPDFFEMALLSLKNQTLRPAEVIIVFDGNLDASFYKIVSSYKTILNIKIVQNSSNLGLAKSLNKGLGYVQNEIIARMDSDDIATEDRFEKQMRVFQQQELDVAVVGGNVGEFIGYKENIVSVRVVPTDLDEIKKFSKYRSPVNHPTALIRTNTLRSIGGYPEQFNKLEDYALWIKLLNQNYKIINIRDVVVYMRISDETYRRRGGLVQVKAYLALRRYMYRIGYINLIELISGSILNSFTSLIPSTMLGFIYKKIRNRQKNAPFVNGQELRK